MDSNDASANTHMHSWDLIRFLLGDHDQDATEAVLNNIRQRLEEDEYSLAYALCECAATTLVEADVRAMCLELVACSRRESYLALLNDTLASCLVDGDDTIQFAAIASLDGLPRDARLRHVEGVWHGVRDGLYRDADVIRVAMDFLKRHTARVLPSIVRPPMVIEND